MFKKLFSIMSMATALFCAVSCDDIMEVIGGLEGGDNNTVTSFSVTPSSLSIKAEGGEATIAFTAPSVWSATSSADWITIDPAAGKSGETIVTITALANTGAERSSKVTVESANFRVDVTVNQAAGGEVNPPEPPAGENKWYICGNFHEWNAENAVEMKSVGNGVYTLDLNLPEGAEFKFIMNKSWEVNFGAVDRGTTGDFNSPSIASGEVVNLVDGGYNLYFEPGGDVTVTLDSLNATAVITGGNTPPQEDVWSIIGTVYGSNWDVDYDMERASTEVNGTFYPAYYARIYYEDGQELKFRSNHSWEGLEFGYGPIIMAEPAVVTAVEKGPNITLPWTGYWDLYITPSLSQIFLFPVEDIDWQYFLNPDGSVAKVTFYSELIGSAVEGKIKYYEVNGVRTCKTETDGLGVLGEGNNRDWYFVWYTDSDRIKLPIQKSGFTNKDYGEATLLSPYYYFGVFNAENNPGLGTYWDFIENYSNYPEAYYDGNGGFYFGVEWYLFVDYSIGYHPDSYDVVGEADGFVRYDYSGSIYVGPANQGVRDITFNVGKDIASVRYLILDEQINDDEKAGEIATQLAQGTIDYNVINRFSTDDGRHYYATVSYTAEVPGYHTVVAVGFDAAGNWHFWYYYWFNLDPYVDPSTYTWTTLGTAEYTDDFFTTVYDVENLTWGVEIEQCDQDPGRLRLIYPYDNKYEYNDEGDWDESKSYDIEIMIPDENHVYILPQEIGVNWGYGMFSIASYAGYFINNGYGLEELDSSYYGTLSEGVITFPEKKLLISMADYDNGGWYYANKNGAFKLVLPSAMGADSSAPKKVAAPAVKKVKNAGKASIQVENHGNGGRSFAKKELKEMTPFVK